MTITGIDLSPAMLAVAHQRAEALGRPVWLLADHLTRDLLHHLAVELCPCSAEHAPRSATVVRIATQQLLGASVDRILAIYYNVVVFEATRYRRPWRKGNVVYGQSPSSDSVGAWALFSTSASVLDASGCNWRAGADRSRRLVCVGQGWERHRLDGGCDG